MARAQLTILQPPSYCQYNGAACDHQFAPEIQQSGFLAYAGVPDAIAATIETAAVTLNELGSDKPWTTWKDLRPAGQVIFCEICKSARTSNILIADVTTINFNVLFELGYAIGLGMPVAPIRDFSVTRDHEVIKAIGMLDTLGQINFRNAEDLVQKLAEHVPTPLPPMEASHSRSQPIYLLKAPIPTQGSLQIGSVLKKSKLGYRVFDPLETPRLPLNEARRNVKMSLGVVADLIDPSRSGATAHNAMCALVCGMAMAQGKSVLMLQEELADYPQPLDYRDVVKPYRSHTHVPAKMRDFLDAIVILLQETDARASAPRSNPLVDLDLGDVAAENEINGLGHYFLPTGQSAQARQGHARLVTGRKGSGKTAIFYDVRRGARRGHQRLVVDLKPEGHQFTQMKESVLTKLGGGLQEHTMVAFWHYILLSEIARSALSFDRRIHRNDPLMMERYETLQKVYGEGHDPGEDLDFAQRLSLQADRVTRRLKDQESDEIGKSLTEVVYSGDYRALNEAVQAYLRLKDGVWLLIDNIDKGWPVGGAADVDILIVRALLEATRKLQRELNDRQLDFHCLVFLRSDIHEMLRDSTPDKGKETAIKLDWEDRQSFEQLIALRLADGDLDESTFSSVWSDVCVPLVEGQASFDYLVDRTLMRPRDVLKFVRHCIDVALNRGHDRVQESDIRQAESLYSTDLVTETAFEISDTAKQFEYAIYSFESGPSRMPLDEALDRLMQTLSVPRETAHEALRTLIWFGVLGVAPSISGRAVYSFEPRGDRRRMDWQLSSGDCFIEVHAGFRAGLDIILDH